MEYAGAEPLPTQSAPTWEVGAPQA
jgi:hypothetical protein